MRPILVLALLVIAPAVAVAQPPIPLLETSTAGFVGLAERGPLDQPTLVTSYGEFVTVFGASTDGLVNPYLAPSVAAFFVNGGARLWVVRVADAEATTLIGTDSGQPGSRTGLQALLDVDEIAVVAIPGAVSLAVQTAMITHAENTGDRLAILDPASLDDIDAVVAQRNALNAPEGHAAFYFPWVEGVPTGETLLLPPSGFVAGICARTDTPDSPFGAMMTATDVSYPVTTPEQDILNPLGINAIRFFAGMGVQLWGARTLSSDPEWRYVAVRRTVDCVDESVEEGTAWCLSEPNDATLWAQLEAVADDFLFALFQAGWFQGATADDAYFVRCDQTTMTQIDLLEGRTIILVGVALQAPAEFIIFSIVHQRPQNVAAPASASVRPRLAPPSPNPFNPATVVRFELPVQTTVTLRIHDLAGRLVRVLVDDDVLPAGLHERCWDGRNNAGNAVASGTYLLRLEAAGVTATRRLTLVR